MGRMRIKATIFPGSTSSASNIGSQQLLRPTKLPFATLERAVLAELHRVFRPELIGRFDEKIVFKPLCPETQREIGRLVVDEELERFREQGFDLTVSDEAFEFLVRRGMHKTLGAQPIRKTGLRCVFFRVHFIAVRCREGNDPSVCRYRKRFSCDNLVTTHVSLQPRNPF
ncbi:MAG: ATP-dependent Clp protease ATP-binding subunit [Verrucomicrobiaceae bacterium]|nr:MAG: ATP-dependent Clp protease ATP-binding subunit [Verrucomicrobiaceae bacterium]